MASHGDTRVTEREWYRSFSMDHSSNLNPHFFSALALTGAVATYAFFRPKTFINPETNYRGICLATAINSIVLPTLHFLVSQVIESKTRHKALKDAKDAEHRALQAQADTYTDYWLSMQSIDTTMASLKQDLEKQQAEEEKLRIATDACLKDKEAKATLHGQVKNLISAITKYQEELASMTLELDILAENNRQLDTQISRLQESKTQLESEIKNLNQERPSRAKNLSETTSTLAGHLRAQEDIDRQWQETTQKRSENPHALESAKARKKTLDQERGEAEESKRNIVKKRKEVEKKKREKAADIASQEIVKAGEKRALGKKQSEKTSSGKAHQRIEKEVRRLKAKMQKYQDSQKAKTEEADKYHRFMEQYTTLKDSLGRYKPNQKKLEEKVKIQRSVETRQTKISLPFGPEPRIEEEMLQHIQGIAMQMTQELPARGPFSHDWESQYKALNDATFQNKCCEIALTTLGNEIQELQRKKAELGQEIARNPASKQLHDQGKLDGKIRWCQGAIEQMRKKENQFRSAAEDDNNLAEGEKAPLEKKQREFRSSQQKIDSLDREIETLESEMDKTESYIRKLKEELTKLEEQIQTLNNQESACDKKIKECTDSMKERDEEIENLESQALSFLDPEEFNEKKLKMKQQTEVLEAAVAQARELNDELTESLSRLHGRLESCQEQIATVSNQLDNERERKLREKLKVQTGPTTAKKQEATQALKKLVNQPFNSPDEALRAAAEKLDKAERTYDTAKETYERSQAETKRLDEKYRRLYGNEISKSKSLQDTCRVRSGVYVQARANVNKETYLAHQKDLDYEEFLLLNERIGLYEKEKEYLLREDRGRRHILYELRKGQKRWIEKTLSFKRKYHAFYKKQERWANYDYIMEADAEKKRALDRDYQSKKNQARQIELEILCLSEKLIRHELLTEGLGGGQEASTEATVLASLKRERDAYIKWIQDQKEQHGIFEIAIAYLRWALQSHHYSKKFDVHKALIEASNQINPEHVINAPDRLEDPQKRVFNPQLNQKNPPLYYLAVGAYNDWLEAHSEPKERVKSPPLFSSLSTSLGLMWDLDLGAPFEASQAKKWIRPLAARCRTFHENATERKVEVIDQKLVPLQEKRRELGSKDFILERLAMQAKQKWLKILPLLTPLALYVIYYFKLHTPAFKTIGGKLGSSSSIRIWAIASLAHYATTFYTNDQRLK